MSFQILGVVLAAITGLLAPPADIRGSQTPEAYAALVQQQVTLDRVRVAGAACRSLVFQEIERNRTGANNIPEDIRNASVTGDVIIEHVRVTGCGRVSRHNLMIFRGRSGGWTAVALVPGASLASPVLQRDSYTAAVRAVIQLSPDAPCPPGSDITQRLRFGEIILVSAPRGGVWVERIPLRYCGLDRSMQVTYTLTPDGGADYALRPLFPMNR